MEEELEKEAKEEREKGWGKEREVSVRKWQLKTWLYESSFN